MDKLSLFKEVFQGETNLNVSVEHFFGDVVILFDKQQLDCDDLASVSNFIKERFTEPNLFTHKLPKVQIINKGSMYLLGIRLPASFLN